MEQEDIQVQLRAQKELLERTFRSVEKIRSYFFWTLIVSIAVIALPAIGLFFALPSALGTLSGTSTQYQNLLQGM